MIYSDTERVVGKWIDGKPLYEKTMYFDNVVVSAVNAQSGLIHNIENLDTGIVVEAYYINSGVVNKWTQADVFQPEVGEFRYLGWQVSDNAFTARYSGGNISASANRKYLIKCRYTKTTDTPTT